MDLCELWGLQVALREEDRADSDGIEAERSRNTLAATATLLRVASKAKVDAACIVEYSCTRPPDDQIGDLRVGAAFCCQMSCHSGNFGFLAVT